MHNCLTQKFISLIFIPVVLSFLAPPNPKQIRHLDRKGINFILDKIDVWVHRYRMRFYLIVLVIIGISVYGITKMTTVGYVVDDLPKKDVIYTDLKFFEQNFRGVLPFEVSVDTKKPGGALSDVPVVALVNEEGTRHRHLSELLRVRLVLKVRNHALLAVQAKVPLAPVVPVTPAV